MMYKAYTQQGWNAEKFFIEENGEPLIIEADSDAEAYDLFFEHIYATSLYSADDTAQWLEDNPLIVEEAVNTYNVWVMMDSESDVISDEHETPDAVLSEMQQKYTIEEMHENGFTLNLLLCSDQQWLECLDEIDY